MLYGVMRSVAHNIGEEIQWLAQQRFLPHIDCRFFSDSLSFTHPKEPVKLIMNGWYTHRIDRFVPHRFVQPLLISMYFHPSVREKIIQNPGKIRHFLCEHGPVGCRDIDTTDFLNNAGIPAYFSSCITLTLVPNPLIERQNYVLAIGLNDVQLNKLHNSTGGGGLRIIAMDRLVPQIFDIEKRIEIAKCFLALYQGAHCIVTNKLHVALPALALGTPVLLITIDPDDRVNDPERMTGNSDLCHHVSPADFVNGKFEFDFNCPPHNPIEYAVFRRDLISRCSEFTNYNNENSLINIVDPMGYLFKLISMPENYRSQYWRTLYHIPIKTIFRHLWRRLVRRKDFRDLRK